MLIQLFYFRNILFLTCSLISLTICLSCTDTPSPAAAKAESDDADTVIMHEQHKTLSHKQKVNILQKILNSLWMASDHRINKVKPHIGLDYTESDAGAYFCEYDSIRIDNKAFDICLALGDKQFIPALSFIIAHELAHHFQSENIKTKYYGLKSSFLGYDRIDDAIDSHERNADLSGVFNMYLAGIYLNNSTLDKLIHELYVKYEKARDSKNYPSEEDRKKTANLITQQFKDLLIIYESAAIFSAFGEDEAAIRSWLTILRYYEGPEIYANLGVAQARKALNLLRKKNKVWEMIFPFETDWESPLRLQEGYKPMSGSSDTDKLIVDAELNLKRALEIKPGYHLAANNLFMVRILKIKPEKPDEPNLERITEAFEELQQNAGNDYQTALLAYANAYAICGKSEKAIAITDSLYTRTINGPDTLLAVMARYNLSLFHKSIKGKLPEIKLPKGINPNRNIDDIDLSNFNPQLRTLTINNSISVCDSAYNHSMILVMVLDKKDKFVLQRIPMNIRQESKHYSQEMRLTVNGSIVVSPSQKAGYRISNGKIVEYFKYFK